MLSGGESWRGVAVFGEGIDDINVDSELVGNSASIYSKSNLSLKAKANGLLKHQAISGGLVYKVWAGKYFNKL